MSQVGKDILILTSCNQAETKKNHVKIFLRINLILTSFTVPEWSSVILPRKQSKNHVTG